MKKLRLLINTDCTDAYTNLAFEEYLLKQKPYGNDCIFMLWRNAPSVIIGKNQNAYREINREFLNEHEIKLVRRLTGGGAVFHDLGNVNFTFICDDEKGELDFAEYALPIARAISALGVDARLNGRNDICVGEKKFSGTAQCIEKGRVLHHGTLLYDADLSRLSGALKVNSEKLKDKGIRSVASRVTNLKSITGADFTPTEFMEYIAKSYAEEFDGEIIKEYVDPSENGDVIKLVKEKYSLFEWNYGASPEFEYTNTKRFPFGSLELNFTAKEGRIEKLALYGDFFGVDDISELCADLTGKKLDEEEIKNALCAHSAERYVMGCKAEDILSMFEF